MADARSFHEAKQVLDTMASDLAQGLVPQAIYNNEDIYRLELDRVFGRCWVFMGHETELPHRGDFLARRIGEDSFILTRGQDDSVHVLFNSCRHRGAQICRVDRGNAERFRCPYHGWTYDSSGALVALPNRQVFGDLREEDWGLLRAPKVDTYRGLIFACLDPNANSLQTYLGDFRWYLDTFLALVPDGYEVLGDPFRWQINGDWKSAAENFCGDGYHLQSLHQSIFETGMAGRRPNSAPRGYHITECSGHSMSLSLAESEEAAFWGYPTDVSATFQPDGLSQEQFNLARRSRSHVINVFPNLSFLHSDFVDVPGRQPVTVLSMRQWQPTAPGRMETWNWTLVPAAAPPAFKARVGQVVAANLSASGAFEQDDTVIWESMARAAGSRFAMTTGAKLNYQMGRNAPLARDWPGPGTVYDSSLEDGPQRTFLRHWLSAMTAEPVA